MAFRRQGSARAIIHYVYELRLTAAADYILTFAIYLTQERICTLQALTMT